MSRCSRRGRDDGGSLSGRGEQGPELGYVLKAEPPGTLHRPDVGV